MSCWFLRVKISNYIIILSFNSIKRWTNYSLAFCFKTRAGGFLSPKDDRPKIYATVFENRPFTTCFSVGRRQCTLLTIFDYRHDGSSHGTIDDVGIENDRIYIRTRPSTVYVSAHIKACPFEIVVRWFLDESRSRVISCLSGLWIPADKGRVGQYWMNVI